jgi:hypothetical protein
MNSTGGWITCNNDNTALGWLRHEPFAHAISDAFWFQIRDSTHQSFNDKGSLVNDPDKPVIRPLFQGPKPDDKSLRLVFDKYPQEPDDHLLDNPAAAYPNIINFKRNDQCDSSVCRSGLYAEHQPQRAGKPKYSLQPFCSP